MFAPSHLVEVRVVIACLKNPPCFVYIQVRNLSVADCASALDHNWSVAYKIFRKIQLKEKEKKLSKACTPCLNSPEKMSNFLKFSGLHMKDDMKIQQGELINILHRFREIYTWLIQNHRTGWETFKCQKMFWNIALVIKASLTIGNGNQYMSNLINNVVKNEF